LFAFIIDQESVGIREKVKSVHGEAEGKQCCWCFAAGEFGKSSRKHPEIYSGPSLRRSDSGNLWLHTADSSFFFTFVSFVLNGPLLLETFLFPSRNLEYRVGLGFGLKNVSQVSVL